MSTNRRKFLKLSALAGGTIGLGLMPRSSVLSGSPSIETHERAAKGLRILILGGTGLTGPYAIRRLRAQGQR